MPLAFRRHQQFLAANGHDSDDQIGRTYVVCAPGAAVALRRAAAQPATATLSGRVVDPQDSAVSRRRRVRVRNAGDLGRVEASPPAPTALRRARAAAGDYDVRVELAGFAPWSAKGLTLPVGQERRLEVRLTSARIEEIDRRSTTPTCRAEPRRVDGVIDRSRIESLPLNGRNFLELALLVPGNQPTPIFDPTKTNSVLIASAGQMGRGGNITIDGQDNNDDVVGGPLLNLPIDAVQEFQIATSRFGADLGRSASSVINVVTRSGTNTHRGTARDLRARRRAGRRCRPRSTTRTSAPPFDRQQMSGALGGPLRRDRLFWFAAGEFRNQDGAVLVGDARYRRRARSAASFAPAPLRRRAVVAAARHRRRRQPRSWLRYAGEWADRHRRERGRARHRIGDAAAGRRRIAINSVLGSWTSAPPPRFVNALSVSVSTFLNETLPVATAPQLTFPSLQDGASFRMPQETQQTRVQIADNATLVRGAHSLRLGGELQRIDAEFGLGVFQQGRIELVQDFPSFDHTGDGRIDDNDLLFAVTLRSGKPDQVARSARRRQHARRRLRAGRLERVEPPAAQPRPALRDRHRGQQPEPRRRAEPDRAAVRRPASASAISTTSARASASPGTSRPTDAARARRLRHLLRPHRAADSVARARPRRPRAADRGARRQRRSSSIPAPAGCRRSRRRWPIRSPASSCPAPARRASTSSIRTCRTRWCTSSTSASSATCSARSVRVDVHAQPGHRTS